MGGADPKDQMLQPYLLEWKKGSKWYVKLFKRLLSVTIHNEVVIYCFLPASKKLTHSHWGCTSLRNWFTGLKYLITYIDVVMLNYLLNDSLNTTLWWRFLPPERSLNLGDGVWCAHDNEEGRNQLTGALWNWFVLSWLLQELPHRSQLLIGFLMLHMYIFHYK
jgi:hypothetical protein